MRKTNQTLLISLITILCLIPIFFWNNSGNASSKSSNNDKVKSTLMNTPKNYRGNWYHYSGHGHYEVVSFTKDHYNIGNEINNSQPDGTKLVQSFKYNSKGPLEKLPTHSNWVYFTSVKAHHSNWINAAPWEWDLNENGFYYKIFNPIYHGKQLKVLSLASGSGIWTSGHYYPSKKLAKQMGEHKFPNQVYLPE